MRWRALFLAAALAVAIGFSLYWLLSSAHRANNAASSANDLTVVFAGFTNDPVWTPSRLAVSGRGKGLHALFAVTNSSTTNFIRFQTEWVERRDGNGWKKFAPSDEWQGMSGRIWAPGFGIVCAVAWPPGLPTNSAWRLQLSIAHEPAPLLRVANERLGRELFQPQESGSVSCPEVVPLTNGTPPNFELLSHD